MIRSLGLLSLTDERIPEEEACLILVVRAASELDVLGRGRPSRRERCDVMELEELAAPASPSYEGAAFLIAPPHSPPDGRRYVTSRTDAALACSTQRVRNSLRGDTTGVVKLHQRADERHGRTPLARREIPHPLDEFVVRQPCECLDAITLARRRDKAGQRLRRKIRACSGTSSGGRRPTRGRGRSGHLGVSRIMASDSFAAARTCSSASFNS